MSKNYKTSKKNRTHYIYYTAEGSKIIITPSENDVTEADIEFLHSWDDAEVDEQRRTDYRTSHLDAYHNGENEEANDRNSYLADDSTNPESVLIDNEDEKAHQDRLITLTAAMESLLPQQLELFKKVYVERRTNTNIAVEQGVTETAIRNRLKKMHEKLRKFFPDRGFE